MSTQTSYVRTLTAAAALSAFSRVYVDSSGQAALATNNDLHIGVVQMDVASGDAAPVRLYHPSFMMKAAGAITAGSQVYPTTSGQISGSAVATEIGMAINAATAANDIIEVAILLN
jgi:hypothetical protein